MLVVGANGSGKTNLLEAVHVGTQGFSPRTRADVQLIRLGAGAARVAVGATRRHNAIKVELSIARGEGKRVRLNGASLCRVEQLRSELPTLVFTPDRLVIVKGGPAVRRAYFDRALSRLLPARATLPIEYGEVLGQRNVCLHRVAAGSSSQDALPPWSEQLATLGASLQDARREVIERLSPRFSRVAAGLGLGGCRLEYSGERLTVQLLEQKLSRDLERGTTSCGPHLDEIVVFAQERELRSFGSQGEQRTAVLALLLAEAELLAEQDTGPPVLLLDDVLSELDRDRRAALADRLSSLGQTIVTATNAGALPVTPNLTICVHDGKAEAA